MNSADMNQLETPSNLVTLNPSRRQYRQIDVEYDPSIRMLWTYMKPDGAPCFNPEMLEELRHNEFEFEKNNGRVYFNDQLCAVDYYVVASRTPNVFSFGGDLALFIMLIKARDEEALMQYAKLCIDCAYSRSVNYNSPVMTISLVQGDALGGGFESVLTSNLIVAEEQARMGFPEIIFNLFPGMGAYSFLARKVGWRVAEEMISSGNIYKAEELHKMGVVDFLAPAGEGEKFIFDLTRKQNRRLNGLRAMYECRRHVQPITYTELINIAKIWVDAALRLNANDLQVMTRLVRSQRALEARTKGNHLNKTNDLELSVA
ncbi:MAG: hypothetical protein RL717_2505 [Pseudomonadota bacterium]